MIHTTAKTTVEEFNALLEKHKSKTKIKVKCSHCSHVVSKNYSALRRMPWDLLNPNKKKEDLQIFCGPKCVALARGMPPYVHKPCAHCKTMLKRRYKVYKRSKSGNIFCNSSCAATYNNINKNHGTRRSKIEVYLEKHLPKLHPDIEFHFNRKDTIGSELDIYIPSLKLAFEINGIFHYEPIYGIKKLKQIQRNDRQKRRACTKLQITLYSVDTRSMARFNKVDAQKFLTVISELIKEKARN